MLLFMSNTLGAAPKMRSSKMDEISAALLLGVT